MAPTNVDEFVQRHVRRKSDDAIVAGVDLQQETGVRADGPLVVARMGAIRGPHFTQGGTALGQNIRNPEGAANFYELAARDHDLFAVGEGVHCDQHGGSVVVHARRGLRTGQPDQQSLDHRLAFSSSTLLEVVFEVGRPTGDTTDRVDRRGCQHRATEVGMKHGARCVDHRAQ